MPEAVAVAIEAFAAAAGTEMTLTAAQIYFASQAIVYTAAYVASSAYSNQQRRKAQASAQAAYLASLKDRELMIRSAVAPRRVIYGRDKVSGPIVYAQSTGEKGEYLHLVIALAAHECDAIETIYFNDVALPDPDGSGDITSGEFGHSTVHTATESVSAAASITLAHDPVAILSVSRLDGDSYGTFDTPLTGGQYSVAGRTVTFALGAAAYSVNYTWAESTPRVRIRKHLGGAGQTADSALIAASGGKWTEQHRGTGICYLYVRLQFDTEVFGQVGLPAISAVVRGRKVRDPRSGLVVWTDNAALCVADWLRDASFGLSASALEVPDSEVIAAANICDETVATSASTSQARYNFNGSFTSQQSPRDVLADLLSGMAGHCVWSQGRWLVRAGAARTADLVIGADTLAGAGVSIVPKASRTDLFNAVRVTYRDPAQAWAEVQAPLVTNATYEAADGGVRIVRSIQLPGAMDAMRAQRMGKIELERERQALTVQLTTNLAAYDLAPTDTCYLTLDRYGFASKLMEVRQRTWSPDGTLAYTVRETAAGVWAWSYGEATTIDLAPDTTLPSPYARPIALAGLSVQSGTDHLMRLGDGTITTRAWLQWGASTDAFVLGGGTIEVQWKRLSASDWQVGPSMPGDSINTYLQPVPDNTAILVRVRAVNTAGRTSEWTAVTHQVVGKTAPPADVVGLAVVVVQGGVRVSWTPSTEIDHAATDLRIGATWSSATPLFNGTANTYTWPWPAAGTYTLSVKHRDTTGNESATAATIAVTVDSTMLVQWANVGGAGRPASYATVGKTLGLPLESWTLNGHSIADLSDGKVGRSALRLVVLAGHYPNQGNYVAIDRTKTYRTRFWARPIATTSGLLYFNLQQFTDSSGTVGPVNGGRSPYKPSGQSRGDHNSLFGSTDQWGEYSYTWGSSDWQIGMQFVRPEFLDNQGGAAGYWEVQDFTFEEVTEVLAAQGVADSAVIAASNAQTSANTANAALANIASDNMLTKGEKPAVILDWTAIVNEQAGISAQGLAYGITTERTNYNNAISDLASYLTALSPSWIDTTVDTVIVGTDFRTKFAEVYYRRQVLLDGVAAAAEALSSAALAAADAAALAAAAAQTSANTANADLANISSDSVLTPDEKPRVIMDRDVIVAEQASIDAQATNYAVTTEKTTYDAAVTALTTYLATLTSAVQWDNLSGNTTIVGATFRAKFADVYVSRQALLDKIAANAKARLGALATLSTVGTAELAAGSATGVVDVAYEAAGVTHSNIS
jgi:hypothetical protein